MKYLTYLTYILIKVVALVAMTAITLENGLAQEKSSEPEIIPADSSRCQRNTINIFNLGTILGQKNEKLFVIARLGTGETSRLLNRHRLNDVKTEFGNNWDPEKILLAEGQRVKGYGRVEIYLGSKLWVVSLIPRNADLCSLCCDRKKVFYEMSVTTGHGRGKQDWFMRIGKPPVKKVRQASTQSR